MVREAEIREFVSKVVEEFAPQRVILFGSHARGDATPDSDVDLLVIMRTEKRTLQQAVEVPVAGAMFLCPGFAGADAAGR